MGEYFVIANLDKKEFLSPDIFATGVKLFEIAASDCGAMTGLTILLSSQTEDDKDSIYGRWAGDRIIIAGDYSNVEVYEDCIIDGKYENISEDVILKLCERPWYRERIMERLKFFDSVIKSLVYAKLVDLYGEIND